MFIALPVGKFHVLCSSSVEKVSCILCPFHPPKQSFHSALFQIYLLDFPSVLPHEVICAFVLNSLLIAVRWSHTSQKLSHSSKISSCIHTYFLA